MSNIPASVNSLAMEKPNEEEMVDAHSEIYDPILNTEGMHIYSNVKIGLDMENLFKSNLVKVVVPPVYHFP